MKSQKKRRNNKSSSQKLFTVLKKLANIKSPAKRRLEISRGNDKFITQLSPYLRRIMPCVKELVSRKAICDLNKFTSRRTPMQQRRMMLHKRQHGGFLQFLSSLLPLAAHAITSLFTGKW